MALSNAFIKSSEHPTQRVHACQCNQRQHAQSIQHNVCMPASGTNISMDNSSCLMETKVDAACVQASLSCLQRLLVARWQQAHSWC